MLCRDLSMLLLWFVDAFVMVSQKLLLWFVDAFAMVVEGFAMVCRNFCCGLPMLVL
jgi:hypothetical protein